MYKSIVSTIKLDPNNQNVILFKNITSVILVTQSADPLFINSKKVINRIFPVFDVDLGRNAHKNIEVIKTNGTYTDFECYVYLDGAGSVDDYLIYEQVIIPNEPTIPPQII